MPEKEWQRLVNYILERRVKNIFEVTHKKIVVGKYTNRYDVILLINGILIVQIELKCRGMDIKQAFNQIESYIKHSYQIYIPH